MSVFIFASRSIGGFQVMVAIIYSQVYVLPKSFSHVVVSELQCVVWYQETFPRHSRANAWHVASISLAIHLRHVSSAASIVMQVSPKE